MEPPTQLMTRTTRRIIWVINNKSAPLRNGAVFCYPNKRTGLFVFIPDWYLTLEDLLERDYSLCARSVKLLEVLLDNLQQVIVVASHDLREHVVVASGEMALHNFWDLFKLANDFLKFGRVGK